MVYYDHGMIGATWAVALGGQRRYGWPIVVLAALAAMFPDWDAVTSHVSEETYKIGHRVWGHNLFAAALGGAALGGLGYWIHQTRPRRQTPDGLAEADSSPPEATTNLSQPRLGESGYGLWIALGIIILVMHPMLDVLYCGWDHNVDWPVGLLWPLVPHGFGRPWMPWHDWGATWILAAGLAALILARPYRRTLACFTLTVFIVYVGVRGALLQWG